MRKGLSPLVATVLLVSITIVVAAVVASWANFYVKGKTQDIQKIDTAAKICDFGNMRTLEDLKTYSGSTLTIGIDNNGKVPLSNFTFVVKGTDGSLKAYPVNEVKTLQPGDFGIFTASAVTVAPTSVVVKSNCADVSSTVTF